jgi:hypothetical protein
MLISESSRACTIRRERFTRLLVIATARTRAWRSGYTQVHQRAGERVAAGVSACRLDRSTDFGRHGGPAATVSGPPLRRRFPNSAILELHSTLTQKRHQLLGSEISENLPVPIQGRRLRLSGDPSHFVERAGISGNVFQAIPNSMFVEKLDGFVAPGTTLFRV